VSRVRPAGVLPPAGGGGSAGQAGHQDGHSQVHHLQARPQSRSLRGVRRLAEQRGGGRGARRLAGERRRRVGGLVAVWRDLPADESASAGAVRRRL